MVSKIGEAIQEAVRQEVRNAIIASPRFSDYRVQDFIDTGAFESIDAELNEIFREEETKRGTNASQQGQELGLVQEDLTQVKSTLGEVQGALNNPKGVIFDQVNKVLANFPIAQLALTMFPLITAALATPAVIDKIIQILISPGGPFDKRLRIILEQQEEQFLDRLQQKRRQLGLDQVVITTVPGFGNEGGRATTNTLSQVKSAGISDIGLNEVEIGLR